MYESHQVGPNPISNPSPFPLRLAHSCEGVGVSRFSFGWRGKGWPFKQRFFRTTLETKGYELSQHKPATVATWLPERTNRPINVIIFGINKYFFYVTFNREFIFTVMLLKEIVVFVQSTQIKVGTMVGSSSFFNVLLCNN